MTETHDFEGNLDETVQHILDTAEDTPEDLKKRLEFARASLREGTSQQIEALRHNLKIEEERKLKIQSSQDARLALAEELERASTDELDSQEMVAALTKVIQEELIESVLTVEDLDTLSVEELREMEKKHPGTLLFAFTTWGESHKDLEVSKLGNEYLPKDGDSFTIDFRGNEEAYWGIGAADLLPPEVRGIKVSSSQGEVKQSVRRVGLKGEERGGFYDEAGDYMPIFSEDTVTVSNVDASIRERFFNEDTKEWDYEAYQAAYGEEEAPYLVVSSSVDGNEAGAVVHRKERGVYGQNLERLREAQPEWMDAAEAASETFERKLRVSVPPSTTFGVIAKESGFDPEAVSSSGCMGLGQFGKAAWMGFLKENSTVAREVLRAQGLDLPNRKSKQLELRKNAILNIYATTWYLAKLAKGMGYDRVDSHSVKDVYLNYHEGVAGRAALENYVERGRGKLYPWQKSNPRAYWKNLNAYASQVAAQTAAFERG